RRVVQRTVNRKLLGAERQHRVRFVSGDKPRRTTRFDLIARRRNGEVALQQQVFSLSERQPRRDASRGILSRYCGGETDQNHEKQIHAMRCDLYPRHSCTSEESACSSSYSVAIGLAKEVTRRAAGSVDATERVLGCADFKGCRNRECRRRWPAKMDR